MFLESKFAMPPLQYPPPSRVTVHGPAGFNDGRPAKAQAARQPNGEKMSDYLKWQTAVEAWIKAEWEFRCGPVAFGPTAASSFEDAADNLRRVATGETDLTRAGAVLGKLPTEPIKRIKRVRPRLNKELREQMNLFER